MSHRTETLQVGVIGARLELEVSEFDSITSADSPVDLSLSSSRNIIVQRPDNTSFTRNASFVSDGTDGKIYIVTTAGDISMSGTYKIQSAIIAPGWDGRSTIGQFEVEDNLS